MNTKSKLNKNNQPYNSSLKKSKPDVRKHNVRTTDEKNLMDIALKDPYSMAHDELLILRSLIGKTKADSYLEEGKRRKGLKSAEKQETPKKVIQKQAVQSTNNRNFNNYVNNKGKTSPKTTYSNTNRLGVLANKFNAKVGIPIVIDSYDFKIFKAKAELIVGEETSASVKSGPANITIKHDPIESSSELEVSADLDIKIATIGAMLSSKLDENGLTLSRGLSLSVSGLTFSKKEGQSLTKSIYENSVSTVPKNGEPMITLKVTVDVDRALATIVAAIILLLVLAPEFAPALLPLLQRLASNPAFA